MQKLKDMVIDAKKTSVELVKGPYGDFFLVGAICCLIMLALLVVKLSAKYLLTENAINNVLFVNSTLAHVTQTSVIVGLIGLLCLEDSSRGISAEDTETLKKAVQITTFCVGLYMFLLIALQVCGYKDYVTRHLHQLIQSPYLK